MLSTNSTIRILFANTIREYFNRPILPHYSNIRIVRIVPEYYSNNTCNVTCYTKALRVRVFTRAFNCLDTTIFINSCLYITISIVDIINIINITINITIIIVKMSNSSLSPPPMSEPSLPTIPPTPFAQPHGIHHPLQLRRTTRKPELPKSDSLLFSAGLFSCTLLDTTPATVQLQCLQPQCDYAPKPQRLDYTITSNYWTHYKHTHPKVAALYNPNSQEPNSQSSSHTSNVATFFTPRLLKPNINATEAFQAKYRALLLDFVVSNNLPLRIVDSQSHRRLIQHCNVSVLSITKSTLVRDLDKTFLSAQNSLKLELQEHIKGGGRISITTDAWSATNFKEFIAVTGHWVNKDWKQRSQLLDVVHLVVSYTLYS